MKIGNYEVFPIETGTFALDGGAMFGVVPWVMWSRMTPPDDRRRITLAARPMLLIGNGKVILVDNGNGSKFSDKLKDIYRLDDTKQNLVSSLQKVGISPDDVTDVILTHLHFDHAGGSTYRENGKLFPTFRNAKHYVQLDHWNQAMSPTEKDRASFMPDDYLLLHQSGMLETVQGNIELFPGISLVEVNGHTASQQLIKVSDGTTTLLYCCDLFPTIYHIPLPYIMAYDLRPLTTLEEKRSILQSAADEGWILFFEHDPTTVAGTVKRVEKGYIFDSAVEM